MKKHFIDKFLALPEFWKVLLLLLGTCFLAYWPVATFLNTLKWDMMDGTLPGRYIFSQFIQDGKLPLWNPYSAYGFAEHSKMRHWYPANFIYALFGTYNVFTVNIEFILHLLLGGMGMYYLGKHFRHTGKASLFMAVSYMLCGFFTSNAQHGGWITSGAWMPVLLVCYFRFLKHPNLLKSIWLGLVFFSFVSGGYPGITFTAVYVLLGILLVETIILLKNKKARTLGSLILWHSIPGVLFILLCGVVLASQADMTSAITRGNGITAEYAVQGSMHTKHLVTLLIPFMNVFTKAGYWHSDISMLNSYFGITALTLAVISFQYIKRKYVQIVLGLVLLFLSIGLGYQLPVRTFLYEHLPLFNLFRLPALFRLFMIFGLIFLAGYSFNNWIQPLNYRRVKNIILTLAIFFGLFVIVSLIKAPEFPKPQKWINFYPKLSKANIIVMQGSAFALILCAGYFIMRRYASQTPEILIGILALEMIVAVQMNIAFTVVEDATVVRCYKGFKDLPDGFPKIDIHQSAKDSHSGTFPMNPPLWRNTNIYHKQISYNNYASYIYRNWHELTLSPAWDTVRTFPIAYLWSGKDSAEVRYPDRDSKQNISLAAFAPNRFELNVQLGDARELILMQNHYPGWKAYINGQETEIHKANIAFMSIEVPKGLNTVVFEYRPRKIVVAEYIYAIALFSIVLGIVILEQKKRKNTKSSIEKT